MEDWGWRIEGLSVLPAGEAASTASSVLQDLWQVELRRQIPCRRNIFLASELRNLLCSFGGSSSLRAEFLFYAKNILRVFFKWTFHMSWTCFVEGIFADIVTDIFILQVCELRRRWNIKLTSGLRPRRLWRARLWFDKGRLYWSSFCNIDFNKTKRVCPDIRGRALQPRLPELLDGKRISAALFF